ncbi:hypothetical protein CPC08DRAFT_749338 [Agrocybe pediades]|nr:hypothetical protein CPC08DRAFT_749338 [Agrocybe pediades]
MSFTAADVKYELDNLRTHLFLEETEDTWEKIGKAISSLTKLFENGGYDANPTDLLNAVRAAHRPITNAMNSERTRLSVFPMELISTIATAMGCEFDQLLPLFMPPLLALCGRTSKVVVNRAKASILSIIEVTQSPAILSYFLANVKDKSASMKVAIAEGTLAFLNSCNPPDIEKEARAVEVEGIIRATARDANADVRKISRKMFESYQILLPGRVKGFSAPLSPTTKKYLDIKSTTTEPTQKTTATRATTSKPELKASTTSKPGHSRNPSSTQTTATSGTLSRNLPTTVTRVSRKEPTPAPFVPQRPIQPSRIVSDSNPQRSNSTVGGPSRTTTVQDVRRPIPPSPTATTSSSSAPRRVAITLTKQTPTTRPKRILMPPPPPPAPKKEVDCPRRPPSRVDNASSTTSHRGVPIVPPAPIKKRPISTVSSTAKDRAAVPSNPPTARSRTVSKPPVPPARPTATSTTQSTSRIAAGTSSSSTSRTGTTSAAQAVTRTTTSTSSKASSAATMKPSAIGKATATAAPVKPTWGGRPAVPVTKSQPATSAGLKAPTTSRPLARKPSTRTVAAPRTAAGAGALRTAVAKTAQRPVSPAMVELPPSPTPEDEEKIKMVPEAETVDDRNKENIKPVVNEAVVEHEEVVKSSAYVVDGADDVAAEEVVIEKHDDQAEEEEEAGSVQNEEHEDTAVVSSRPASVEPANIAIPQIETDDEFDEEVIVQEDEQEDGDRTTSFHDNSDDPRTPQQQQNGGLSVPAHNHAALATKTPISALLNSIERGFKFDYSPITPLSPADCYLPNINGETPYSHQTHAPHVKGPMQPFNHALHAPGQGGIFGGFGVPNSRKEEELVRGDIGVVQLSEYTKQYVSASLPGLDDGRQAFTELNRS